MGHSGLGLETSHFEKSRKDISGHNRHAVLASRLHFARPANDPGNTNTTFVDVSFVVSERTIGEERAVVRSENDKRVVCDTKIIE